MRLAAILTVACIASAAGVDPVAGGVSLGYTHNFAGSASLDGQDRD